MIKAEVVFEKDSIFVGGYKITMTQWLSWRVERSGLPKKEFQLLEQAIDYCIKEK